MVHKFLDRADEQSKEAELVRLDEHRHSTMLGPDDSFSQVAGMRADQAVPVESTV
jgi:hypothetical protein